MQCNLQSQFKEKGKETSKQQGIVGVGLRTAVGMAVLLLLKGLERISQPICEKGWDGAAFSSWKMPSQPAQSTPSRVESCRPLILSSHVRD